MIIDYCRCLQSYFSALKYTARLSNTFWYFGNKYNMSAELATPRHRRWSGAAESFPAVDDQPLLGKVHGGTSSAPPLMQPNTHAL